MFGIANVSVSPSSVRCWWIVSRKVISWINNPASQPRVVLFVSAV